MNNKIVYFSLVSVLGIMVSSEAIAWDNENTKSVSPSKQECEKYLLGKSQNVAEAETIENSFFSELNTEEKNHFDRACGKNSHNIFGASRVREGEYEQLSDIGENVEEALEPKRAVFGNRFDNGTKTWREDGSEYQEFVVGSTPFKTSQTYKGEIALIGAGKSGEYIAQLEKDSSDVLQVPEQVSKKSDEKLANSTSGVVEISKTSSSASENDLSALLASNVGQDANQATPINIYQGKGVAASLDIGDGRFALSLDDALSQAAKHAPQIAVFKQLPAIRETSVLEAEGRFKPEVFVEARYEDRDIPTTSLAQTAGDDRLREDDFATEFGVRKRVRSGAEVTLSQRFSSLETNLIEFDPAEQSRSRTVINVRQPILRGGGFSFNRALDNVAKLETDVAVQEFRRQSENHLLEVARAYWNLYLARAFAINETQSVVRIDNIVDRIENRRGIDAQRLQVTRAKAARAEQRSSLVRARNAVRNAEARLRALISSPNIRENQAREIIPQDVPNIVWKDLPIENLVQQAIERRPEIMQANYQHKASIIRKGISANEALPQLDLILEGSLNGREDNFNFGGAFTDGNEADYLVGIRFSMPIGRDERKARHKRRRLEELQQRRQIETTVTSLQLETEISVNEYAVAYEEFLQRKDALELAQQDYDILKERWQRGVGNDGIVFLDMLLEANRRLLLAQGELSEAIVTFKYSEANLERTRGQYLQSLGYRVARNVSKNGTPGYTLERTQ